MAQIGKRVLRRLPRSRSLHEGAQVADGEHRFAAPPWFAQLERSWYLLRTVIVRLVAVGYLHALASLAACSSVTEPAPDRQPSWLDAPSAELPERMSELGLYAELPELARVHDALAPYRPAYELWSNGTTKDRFLYLPPACPSTPASATLGSSRPERCCSRHSRRHESPAPA